MKSALFLFLAMAGLALTGCARQQYFNGTVDVARVLKDGRTCLRAEYRAAGDFRTVLIEQKDGRDFRRLLSNGQPVSLGMTIEEDPGKTLHYAGFCTYRPLGPVKVKVYWDGRPEDHVL